MTGRIVIFKYFLKLKNIYSNDFSNISSLIYQRFRFEELKNELLINKFRIFILLVIFFLMTLSFFIFKEIYINRYLLLTIVDVFYLIICLYFHKKINRGIYSSFYKYFFATFDVIIITLVIIITRNTVNGKSFTSIIDITEVDLLFLVNILSGLRFDFKFSLFTIFMSILALMSLAGYDYIMGVFRNVDVKIKYLFTTFYLILIGIASGYIGVRAKEQIIKNFLEYNEKNIARDIQLHLIPQKDPVIEGVRFGSLYKPMKEIGGDFYDYVFFNNKDLIGIFICDVSGHGTPAALITSMIKGMINVLKDKSSPAELLNGINKNLIEYIGDNFVTAFYGIYDNKKRIFTYARAGHNPPFLIRDNKIIELKGKGSILGYFDFLNLEEKKIKLKKGDKILFYTDGLIETRNKEDEEYEKRLKDILKEMALRDKEITLEVIFNDLIKYKGNSNFEDDICLICMKLI